MLNHVVVFYGSKKDFEQLLHERIDVGEETVQFMELIQNYNSQLRPQTYGGRSVSSKKVKEVDNCIVRSDDYGSVYEHVLSNFVSIVTLNYDIHTIYVHNPPKRVLNSLFASCGENIEYLYSDYVKIDRKILKQVKKRLDEDILGQTECKEQLLSGLYKLVSRSSGKPAVLMLYGPSGVGKTETAKCISKVLGGELLRVQFSMMQTAEAFNYVFGGEHSKGSFAKDMMARETNIILIDEFDKVESKFYNAFYELFDEGRYVDPNYEVDLHDTVFICTSNYRDETEIKNSLGPAMYSRIGCCIEYKFLAKEQKCIILRNYYEQILADLQQDEKEAIAETPILAYYISHADEYNNIRILKNRLENAVFDELTKIFILND